MMSLMTATGTLVCEDCGRKGADFLCVTCGMYQCSACSMDKHFRTPNNGNHMYFSIEGDRAGLIRLITTGSPFCCRQLAGAHLLLAVGAGLSRHGARCLPPKVQRCGRKDTELGIRQDGAGHASSGKPVDPRCTCCSTGGCGACTACTACSSPASSSPSITSWLHCRDSFCGGLDRERRR